jgi:hypothetical protein
MDYARMVREALRQVVRQAMEEAAAEGLPAGHHFYVTFATDHPDVSIDRVMQDIYPESMTIVLQHQYWDLAVDDEGFDVTLAFDGVKRRLRVPFGAIRSFADPEAEFGLSFEEPPVSTESGAGSDEPAPPEAAGPAGSHAKVVSLDEFRKK